ncbi:GNAT family N-acetyltransferase [Corynebacterium comes]|uniref:Acetyltransferase (GNAT) family protein n=1 Tax=Corynebacterium comes TaxID=2675218 RepID=A0A6B8VZU0_9CORY|nr:GNAT family N-acetyltransferase [Corynebacterium comes]QGU04216.1 Acetyltransferase (GNAT) family protein [Corynebacterium comes]
MTTIRPLRADEQALLAQATLGNVNWAGPRIALDDIRTTPELSHYVASDEGLVAEDGGPVGVVWLRFFPADAPGYGFVDESIPELSIWVAEGHRGMGLGGQLLTEIIELAREKNMPGISLSVEKGNPARHLYERHGFLPAGGGRDPGTLVLRF